MDAQALIAEATVYGDIGRAVARPHVLKAGSLIDRVKGRSNTDGELRCQGWSRGAFQITIGLKQVVFQPSLPGDFGAGVLLAARIQRADTVGGQPVVGQPPDFPAQMQANRPV